MVVQSSQIVATFRLRSVRDTPFSLRQMPVDLASTALPSGKPITGSVELTAALLEREDQLVQALAHKLMMYALGREVEYFDMPQVRAVVQDAAAKTIDFVDRQAS